VERGLLATRMAALRATLDPAVTIQNWHSLGILDFVATINKVCIILIPLRHGLAPHAPWLHNTWYELPPASFSTSKCIGGNATPNLTIWISSLHRLPDVRLQSHGS
jgi:hypothetical protein